ncbi:MAG: type IV secretion system DNA-binding domain-containing protein [Desulfobacteraceae bacterium]|nr:type IV secretion system DNA-binding domain-containing protein [Desulfobacteraceae bacterium]
MALLLEYGYLKKTVWSQAALLGIWVVYGTTMLNPFWTLAVAAAMGAIAGKNALALWNANSRTTSLSQPVAVAKSVEDLTTQAISNPDRVMLGRGFVWENLHVQQYHDIMALPERREILDLETPLGGYEFMHALNARDKEVAMDKDKLQHTLIAGTTGSGKTKFFEWLVSQLCAHESVVIVDPKGDKELLDGVYDACVDHGVEDRFVFFSLAHPSRSTGFNPFSNYGGPSDVADRIASIMPASSGDQAFRNFAWQVIEVVASAMMGIQENITLEKLQRYSMEDMSELVALCEERMPEIPADIRQYAEKSAERLRHQAGHPKEHYQKMITSLGPVLTSLNTGDIAPLLNAPPDNSIRWQDVLEQKKIVYFDLSSMLRVEVANNVGKMIVQDLMYFIGEIYAFENTGKAMNLFVDEFYSVMFPGYIDMLNKSRGAGLRMFLGMQTTADIANALGGGQESYVRQVLGNINNKIYLRVPELNLAQEFCDLFGKTYIKQVEDMQGERSHAASPSELFVSNSGKKQKQVEVDMVGPEMLMHLPIGQAFAFLQARDPYKLKLPLIQRPEENKNHFAKQIMQSSVGKFTIEDKSPWAELDDSMVQWPEERRRKNSNNAA